MCGHSLFTPNSCICKPIIFFVQPTVPIPLPQLPLANLTAVKSDALSIHQLSRSQEVREVEDGQDRGAEEGRGDEEGMVKPKSTASSINELVSLGVLHDKELGGWRASK
jgi:hypothetical protein